MIIKSFLPDPVGKDTEGEEITLFNNGIETVGLQGWFVKDAAGKEFFLRGVIEPNTDLVLPYSKTKIQLNNNGETVSLYNIEGNLVDELSYVGKATEGKIVERNAAIDGVFGASELLEDWPELSGVINNQSQLPSFFLAMFILSAVLAGVSVYAYKKLYGDEKSR